MGYRLNCLDEPVLMKVPNAMLTEFGIHYRLESCGDWLYLLSNFIFQDPSELTTIELEPSMTSTPPMGAGAAGGATARYVFGFYCLSLKLDFKQLRLRDAPRVLVCFKVLVVHNFLLKLPFFCMLQYHRLQHDGIGWGQRQSCDFTLHLWVLIKRASHQKVNACYFVFCPWLLS